jgi:Domain of unknown function (DUF3471)
VLANENSLAPATIALDLGIIAEGGKVILPSERKEIHVDPQALERYVGNYQFVSGVNIAITRDGDDLYEQVTNQPKIEIFPESEKEFFLKVVDAQLTFVIDEHGKATELILHMNGIDQPAPRVEGTGAAPKEPNSAR